MTSQPAPAETVPRPGLWARWRVVALLVALVALALAGRLPFVLRDDVLKRDGMQYVALARVVQQGRLDVAFQHGYPPGYPALVGLAAAATGVDPGEEAPQWKPERRRLVLRDAESDAPYIRLARLVSALLGALSVVPLFYLGRAAGGFRAGCLAALLLALSPYHALYSHAALSEASFGFFLLATLALALAAGRAWAARTVLAASAGSSLLAGAAYLVRPEGLCALAAVAVFSLLWGVRRRLRLLGLLAPFAAVVGVFLVHLNRTRPAFQISGKRDAIVLLIGAWDEPLAYLQKLFGNLEAIPEFGHPLLVLLSIAGLVLAIQAARRWDHDPERAPGAAAMLCGLTALGHLLVTSTVRTDRRFALVTALALLPLAGLAADWAIGHIRWALCRLSNGRLRPLATPLVLALIAGATVPVLLHKNREVRPEYREAARRLTAEAASIGRLPPRVFAIDERLLYYAGAPEVERLRGETAASAFGRAVLRGDVDFVALTSESQRRTLERTLTAVAPSAELASFATVPAPQGDRAGGVRLFRLTGIRR